jgi:hypothetical protein
MTEPESTNPECPICGEIDWFGDPRWDYMLYVVNKGTTEAYLSEHGGLPLGFPVEGFICRSCRFFRLRAIYGTLDWGDSENAPKAFN